MNEEELAWNLPAEEIACAKAQRQEHAQSFQGSEEGQCVCALGARSVSIQEGKTWHEMTLEK